MARVLLCPNGMPFGRAEPSGSAPPSDCGVTWHSRTTGSAAGETVVEVRAAAPAGPGRAAATRILTWYRLLTGAADQLRSRVTQMEARLAELERAIQASDGDGGLRAERNALQGAAGALRVEQKQLRAELSRLQSLLASLR